MFEEYRPNFIDLFAGAGGLSEGFVQAGFVPVAHVEADKYAAQTLETRVAYHYLQSRGALDLYYDYEKGIISRDELLSSVPLDELKRVINERIDNVNLPDIYEKIDNILQKDNVKEVDIIFGGPPCQAYSMIGRAQSSHMRVPMENDQRNDLYVFFAEFLKKYKPKMFVFENVKGLLSARKGEVFKSIQRVFEEVGYFFDYRVLNAADFGVLQNRQRIIMIGWRKDTEHYYPNFVKKSNDAKVWDLLRDLSPVERGEKRNSYILGYDECSEYLKLNNIRKMNDVVTLHEAKKTNWNNVRIYKLAIDTYNRTNQQISYGDLPKDLRTHKNVDVFKDRYKVIEGNDNACHTIMSHFKKDGNYCIHPDVNQCRSITVREAARLQSFPDDFYFEGCSGAQFAQVGNAVPPMMAKLIAEEIKKQLILE